MLDTFIQTFLWKQYLHICPSQPAFTYLYMVN